MRNDKTTIKITEKDKLIIYWCLNFTRCEHQSYKGFNPKIRATVIKDCRRLAKLFKGNEENLVTKWST